eukprot:TRINITY_DN6263_c0_g1_i2.p1 TRINITY_DN6263_c0_g1~~TRINITY_DN6263_c0_g1_i2.p1  ORF type:complete len:180 (+),score=26.15 TRINITY_DN6263_c0_g1_i2:644-1183(+)
MLSHTGNNNDNNTTQHHDRVIVALPGGTGTTAFYLGRALNELGAADTGMRVACVPCAGSVEQLRASVLQLAESEDEVDKSVWFLNPPADRYRFGKPSPALYHTWGKLQQETQLPFDLLYAPRTWQTLHQHFAPPSTSETQRSLSVLIYLHTGGLEGNPSMLLRYPHPDDDAQWHNPTLQ